ncbi:Rieske (2Fe-2S) protein [Modestobacter sp. DSM 44400]|uniref:Rieske (2Fe-2S) protein n=1 Tax=Modestobacter sp. DSM 44400 TaxID=1550230 RepID=UPI001C31789E|nr:Rieske (2Fe-2S) protein [Modestobacter sp. DSM 44400]
MSRRSLLIAGGAGLCALALAGCGGGIDLPELTGVASGDVLVALADVPVEGGYLLEVDGRRVVITQPSAGTVAAFDATCPHAGCTVRPTGDGLGCPCHGSAFDPATGEVREGPATSPLIPVGVTVRGNDVVLV